MLPDCAEEDAMAVSERLRAAVASSGGPVPLTASAGVATFPYHAHSDVELIAAADDALRATKDGGRNRSTASRRRAGRDVSARQRAAAAVG